MRHWAEAEAETKRRRDAEDATRRAHLPAQIVASLDSQGITLALDKSGKTILAAQGGQINHSDRAALVEHKDAIVKILQRRIEASALVAVA